MTIGGSRAASLAAAAALSTGVVAPPAAPLAEANTVAPMLDPTAYMRAAGTMEQIARLARAMRRVKQVADEIAAERGQP